MWQYKFHICLCVSVFITQREAAIHQSKCKNGPFTSSLYPRDYFQNNPYRSNRPLPPAHKPLPATQATPPVPFKPSSLAKKVSDFLPDFLFLLIWCQINCVNFPNTFSLAGWKQGRSVLILCIPLIHTPSDKLKEARRSQSSALPVDPRARQSRVSSLWTQTGAQRRQTFPFF